MLLLWLGVLAGLVSGKQTACEQANYPNGLDVVVFFQTPAPVPQEISSVTVTDADHLIDGEAVAAEVVDPLEQAKETVRDMVDAFGSYGDEFSLSYSLVEFGLRSGDERVVLEHENEEDTFLDAVQALSQRSTTKFEEASDGSNVISDTQIVHAGLQSMLNYLEERFLMESPNKHGTDRHFVVFALQDTHGRKAATKPSEEQQASFRDMLTRLKRLVDPEFWPTTTVSWVFDMSRVTQVDLMGSDRHFSSYKDGSNVAMGLTLNNIIHDSKTQASTWLAHMLSIGVWSRTINLHSLGRSASPVWLYPFSSRGHYRLTSSLCPDLCNAYTCDSQRSCSRTRVQCDEQEYCSPTHGCVSLHEGPVEVEVELQADGSQTSLAFDKSPPSPVLETRNADKVANYVLDNMVVGKVPVLQWDHKKDFVEYVTSEFDSPVVLQNSVVAKWPALKKWKFDYLRAAFDKRPPPPQGWWETEGQHGYERTERHVEDELSLLHPNDYFEVADHRRELSEDGNVVFHDVKQSVAGERNIFFDPYSQSKMMELPGFHVDTPFNLVNLTVPQFFDKLTGDDDNDDSRYYYFGRMPKYLLKDISPFKKLYLTKHDRKMQKQYLWISSSDVATHWHFDQDYNVFVQVVGTKRFTFVPRWQHKHMHVFPRVHPMWHKSRMDFHSPNLDTFPDFQHAEAFTVTLQPGDVLYVPPYTWHHVETLTPSVSITTWSHVTEQYANMNEVYSFDHKIDTLSHPRGKMFALRLYLDLLLGFVYGPGMATTVVHELLVGRFKGLEHIFPPHADDQNLCRGQSDLPENANKMPTSQHTFGEAKLDATIMRSHFQRFEPAIRDQLLFDYLEDLSVGVVGVDRLYAFFRYCFQGQGYYVTTLGTPEHVLWD